MRLRGRAASASARAALLVLLGVALTPIERVANAQDAFELDEPPETDEPITETLSYGIEVGLDAVRAANLDLARPGIDRSEIEPTLDLALSWLPRPSLRAFLDIEVGSLYERDDDTRNHTPGLRAREAHLTLLGPGLALQGGRLPFEDPHRWLYDDELDGIRAVWRAGEVALDGSISRLHALDLDLLDDEPDDAATNLFLVARRRVTADLVGSAYALHRRGLDDEEDLTFLGVQVTGDLHGLSLGFDGASVAGEVDHEGATDDVLGFGADLRLGKTFDVPLAPSLTIGLAFGSGDGDPDDQDDRAFRQTGLQSNEVRFGGLTRIGTYGEVLAPELSNLWVWTLAAGLRPCPMSSIDLVWHLFRLDEPEGGLRDSGLDVEPTGIGRRVGQEVDLVLSYAGPEDLEAEVTLGAFLPGDAFIGRTTAWLIALELTFEL